MKSGGKIQPTNKNSFAPSNFDNEFLSDDESESYQDSSIKESKNDKLSNNNSFKV